MPVAIHNGTGPVELSCFYHVDEMENGLVIKWYHNAEQIYQWIPPSEFSCLHYILVMSDFREKCQANFFVEKYVKYKIVVILFHP